MWLDIYSVAIVVAVACALPGVFLVIRGTTMLSDAITHSVLLGIVLAFFITNDLNSPFLLIGATLIGLVVVWLIEALQRTKLMSSDAAIGIVFPLFFSLGIILITRYAGDVHLDTDSVLLGELAFAPFDRVILFGHDIGTQAMYSMSIILVVLLLFIGLFYKELKLTSFDAMLAASLGFSPVLLHYALMSLVSVTAVGAFEAVGSILVVAFMVGPPVSAYLLTNRLSYMLGISAGLGALNSIIGFQLSMYFDASIAGMIAVVTGLTFLVVFVFSPKKGLIHMLQRRKKQQKSLKKALENQLN